MSYNSNDHLNMANNSLFTHLLITRFNVDYSRNNVNEYICDDEWHKDRFVLFNRFCLASVAQQSNKDFKWLIFFNEQKRAQYYDFIEETKLSQPNIDFIFVKPVEGHKNLLSHYIKSHITSQFLITTRMDNDDSISRSFIKSIQDKFLEVHQSISDNEFIINAGCGYQLELAYPYRKSKITGYKFSPFLTHVFRLNSSSSISTVLNHQHQEWGAYANSVELPVQPGWTQIIHQRNVANRVLTLHLLPAISDQNFPVLKNVANNKRWLGILMLPLQYLITAFQRVVKKIRKLSS